MYSPIIKDIFVSYALKNYGRVSKLISKDPVNICHTFIKETMESSIPSQKIREMIVALYMGMKHNFGVNGADAIARNGLPWEIKTEQPETKVMCGVSSWHYTNEANLEKYKMQRVLQSGFHKGTLVYIASWEIAESDIIPMLIEGHKHGKDKNSFKVGHSTWRDFDSAELHFLRKEYMREDVMCRNFMETLEDLEEDFERTADVI